MPTFGRTSIGSSFNNFPHNDDNSACMFALSEAGLVRKLTVYYKGTSTSPLHEAGLVRASIYNEASNLPTSLIATTTEVTVTTADGWVDFPFATPVSLAAGNYFLNVCSALRKVGAMSTAGTNRLCMGTYANAQLTTWGSEGNDASSTNQKSIYATYDLPGVGSATGTGTASGVGSTAGMQTAVGLAEGEAEALGVSALTTVFGKTDIGAAFNNFPAPDDKSVCLFNLPINGNVQKLTIYFKGTNASHQGGLAQGLIYSVTGGEPDVLIASSDVTTVPDGVDGWLDFPFASEVPLTAGDYYIGIIAHNRLYGAMDVAGTNRRNDNPYDGSTLFASNPFGTAASTSNQKSVYATYSTGETTTEGAGVAAGTGAAEARTPSLAVAAATGVGEALGIAYVQSGVNLSRVGSASASGSTLTIPAHIAGDLIVAYAYRDGSTVPTRPSGWTLIREGTGSSTAAVLAYQVATGAGTAFGTWTSANVVACLVYRGSDASAASPIGVFDMDAGTTATMTYATLPLSRVDGSSWVAGFAGISLGTSDVQTAPTGMVNQTSAANGSIAKIAAHDTNAAVNVWGLQTVTLNGAAPWRSITVEILGTLGGTPPVELGVQIARPVSDIATDNWVPSFGTQLAPLIDEVAPVDSDFIQTVAAPTTDTAIVLLSPLTTPQITSPYTIRVRARTVTAGTTVHVASGGNIQAAINAAADGSIITLAPDTIYDLGASPLLLTKPITLMTQGWSFNGRVGLAQKSSMAQIQMLGGNQVIIVRGGTATDVTLKGLHIAGPGNVIVNLGENDSTQTSYDQMPTRCTVDQCIVSGVVTGGNNTGYHGVMLHCAYGNVYRSYIYNIYRPGTDSTGVGGCNGTGPYNIVDNFISAASENILFGGVTPQIPYNIPADMLIEGNTLEKDAAWQANTSVAIKNMVEFKTGRRAMVRNNIIGYQWFSAQGYSLVVTPSQYSGPPWQICEDITFERNTIGPTCGGLNLLGHGQNQDVPGRATLVSERITVRDNWFIVDKDAYLPGQSQGQGWFFMIGSGMKDLVIEYNTVEMRGGGNQWVTGNPNSEGGFPTGHVLRGNLIHSYGTYGTFLSVVVSGVRANRTRGEYFFDYFPGAICESNALIGPQASAMGPRLPGNLHGSTTAYPASLIVNGYGTGTLAGYGRRPV